jgi:serine/threonine protein phosphatase 1
MAGAPMTGRTFAIGDIHGEAAMLDRLLAQLPWISPDDTLLFIGDYLDRGPDSRGVVERLRRLPEETAGKVVCLRGNHEDAWIESLATPNLGFLLPPGNGCHAAFASFTDRPIGPDGLALEDFPRFVEPIRWMPEPVVHWLHGLPIWYEDAHAIYVHAGLDGEGATWRHPRDGAVKPLLWMREPDFYRQYEGKPVVFGHTHVKELPPEDEDRVLPWRRGPLLGIDTGAGRGGPLTAVALPDGAVFQAAPSP